MDANDEAKQHIVALAQRLHEFCHHTKEWELELWHQLSHAMGLPRVERLLAKNREEMNIGYNKFVQ